MSKENYSNIRSVMHTYSRAPLAEGQQHIDQATVRAGHRISIDEVRAEKIPIIALMSDRSKYLIEENGKMIVGGELGKSYTKIMKFISKASLKEIPNTNGEAFLIVDDNNESYTDWIDPSDAPVSQNALSEGYALRLIGKNGIEIQRDYGWDFDSFNGILHFSSKFKPGIAAWNDKGFGNPVVEGFVYIGKHMSDISSDLNATINSSKEIINDAIAQCLAIQPFKFSSDLMLKIGNAYQIENTGFDYESRDWFQTVTFIVPGYCFEITSLDKDETVITEMRHLSNGDTQIFMDLPWDVNFDKPIIKYAYSTGVDGQGTKYPVYGTYYFVATTFVTVDGQKIIVKPTIDYSLTPSLVPGIPEEYQYTMEEQLGVQSPYPVGSYVGGYPGNLATN